MHACTRARAAVAPCAGCGCLASATRARRLQRLCSTRGAPLSLGGWPGEHERVWVVWVDRLREHACVNTRTRPRKAQQRAERRHGV
eukprot:6365474-Prymnesium_polylepis.2